jgi:hypothetical protein
MPGLYRGRYRVIVAVRGYALPEVSAATVPGSFTLDAAIRKTVSGSLGLDAALRKTQSSTFSLDAALRKTQSGSFTLDAWLAEAFVTDADYYDSFSPRVVSGSLGTSSDGNDWTNDSGWDVGADVASRTFSDNNNSPTAGTILEHTAETNVRVRALIDWSRSPVGGFNHTFSLVARKQSGADTHYTAQYQFRSTDSSLRILLRSKKAGSYATLDFPTIGTWSDLTAEAYWVELIVTGDGDVEGRMWLDGDTRPASPQAFGTDASSPITAAGTTGFWANSSDTVDTDLHIHSHEVWILEGVVEASFTLDAAIRKTQSGSLALDAVLRRTMASSFLLDAAISRTISGAIALDAAIRRTMSGLFTADAAIRKTTEESFALDAAKRKTQESSFTADATVRKTQAGTLALDAAIAKTQTVSLTLDAVIARVPTGSFSADSVIARTMAGSFVIDAVKSRAETGSFTADATITKTIVATFTADAVIRRTGISDSFTIDATFEYLPAVWTTPLDGTFIEPDETLYFLMPWMNGPIHFEIQIDTDPEFGSPFVVGSNVDQTGWEFWDGDSWEPVPLTGVPSIYAGNEARWTITPTLGSGTYYRRVRAGRI